MVSFPELLVPFVISSVGSIFVGDFNQIVAKRQFRFEQRGNHMCGHMQEAGFAASNRVKAGPRGGIALRGPSDWAFLPDGMGVV